MDLQNLRVRFYCILMQKLELQSLLMVIFKLQNQDIDLENFWVKDFEF